jgi:hypothetical protein
MIAYDVRLEQRQPEHAAEIQPVDLLGRGKLSDVAALSAIQQPLPAVRPGERLDERAVDARPRALGSVTYGHCGIPGLRCTVPANALCWAPITHGPAGGAAAQVAGERSVPWL